MAMIPYVIKQGDYLVKLAHELGFDLATILDHEKNAELKKKRPNPNVLYPGDVLFIPEPTPPATPVAQGTSNDYGATVPTVKVTLVLEGDGKPMANQACEVEGLPETSATTDGQGEVTFEVPVNVREFTVTLTGTDYQYQVMVAHVDPPTEQSGIRQRLTNLGHYRRASDPEDAEAYAGAVASFQQASGLPQTGEVDDATRDAIVAAHGS